MDIDFSAVFIAQNEIPISRLLQFYVFVASAPKQLTELRYVLVLNSYVQVLVGPALLTEESINAPAAIDPDFDAQAFQGLLEIDHVARNHRRLQLPLCITSLSLLSTTHLR